MSPAFVFAFVLASLYGLVFYVVWGHGGWRLVLYGLVSVLGFFLGQGIARLVGLALLNIGEVNVVEGTLTSWLSLFAWHAWQRR